MLFLRRLFRRRPIKMGFIDDSATRRSSIRSAGFVSFFSESDCVARRSVDHHDLRLRRQKRVKALAVLLITGMCTWFVVESAQALSTF